MKKKLKKNLDSTEYFSKSFKLLKLSLPKIFSRETIRLLFSSFLFFFKTFLNIYSAETNGSIVKAILSPNILGFIKNVKIKNIFHI